MQYITQTCLVRAGSVKVTEVYMPNQLAVNSANLAKSRFYMSFIGRARHGFYFRMNNLFQHYQVNVSHCCHELKQIYLDKV